MIYLTGDTHGGYDSQKLYKRNFKEGWELTRNDYLIILGDFGYIFDYRGQNKEERYHLNELNKKPWTTLFLDGNHENHKRLMEEYPVTENWNGGKVQFIRENIIHLMRGNVYRIDGMKLFVMGGALSIDKLYRTPYVSWWPEEIPSKKEMDYGLEQLEQNGNQVDYVLTHTAPESILYRLVKPINGMDDPTGRYLEHIKETVKFKKWYFGHLHFDNFVDDTYRAMYNNICKLGE